MYYNWEKVITYDASITMVVGARGIGKTYGLRKFCIKNDYIKRGKRYVEIVRYKNQISNFMSNYFAKLSMDDDFKSYEFKTVGNTGYICKEPSKKDKEWDVLFWCVALTDAQRLKTRTFDNVKRIIFDEFILDTKMRVYYKYLPNEVAILQDVVDTISRETQETKNADKVRIMMLGNALDSLNPYFIKFGLYQSLKKGTIKWFNNKRGVLHYVEVSDEYKEMKENSVAFSLADNDESDMPGNNEFVMLKQTDFIVPKTEQSKCMCMLINNNYSLSLWFDVQNNAMYVCKKQVDNAPRIALTIDAANTNNIIAKRSNKIIKLLLDMLYINRLFYDEKSTQLMTLQILQKYAKL